jgi:hypothetical protein
MDSPPALVLSEGLKPAHSKGKLLTQCYMGP